MYTIVRQPKSVGVALLLTFLFGPIGLLYASVTGGLLLMFAPLIIIIIYGVAAHDYASLLAFILIAWPFFIVFIWLISIVWSTIATNKYNKNLFLASVSEPVELLEDNTVSTIPYEQIADDSTPKRKSFNLLLGFIIIALVSIIGYLLIDRKQFMNKYESTQISQSDASVYSAPNVKSKILAEIGKDETIEVVNETVYFTKIKLTQKDGNIVKGFVKKPFVNNYLKSTIKDHSNNLIKNGSDNEITFDEKRVRFLWRESFYIPEYGETVKRIHINNEYCKTIPENEKALLGFLGEYIGSDCTNNPPTNKNLYDYVDGDGFRCAITNSLNLGENGGVEHKQLIRKWFTCQPDLIKYLDSPNVKPSTASVGNNINFINLETKGDIIKISYGFDYWGRDYNEKNVKEESIFRVKVNCIEVVKLGKYLEEITKN